MLWSKETSSRSSPAVFRLDDKTQALTLRNGIQTAPWLHLHLPSFGEKQVFRIGQQNEQRPHSQFQNSVV
eukprot:3280225-Karenia_brevis.AAC.1